MKHMEQMVKLQELGQKSQVVPARQSKKQPKLASREKEIVGPKTFEGMCLYLCSDRLPYSYEYGEQYEANNNCNGWCKKEDQLRVAMSVMMDESHEHNGVYAKGDEAEKDLLVEAHI